MTSELLLQRDPKQIGRTEKLQYSKLTEKNNVIFYFGIKALFMTERFDSRLASLGED